MFVFKTLSTSGHGVTFFFFFFFIFILFPKGVYIIQIFGLAAGLPDSARTRASLIFRATNQG